MYSMLSLSIFRLHRYPCQTCRWTLAVSKHCYNLDTKYSDEERKKIIDVLNKSDKELLSRYAITKGRIKQFTKWKQGNEALKTLADVELLDGFSEMTAKKLFDSILEGPSEIEPSSISSKIKGQVLQPSLNTADIKNIKTVLAVTITVKSVSWTHFNKENYELLDWRYRVIDYPEGKKFQITEILDIAWQLTLQLPVADVYCMKAEATSLRAGGGDPSNAKVLAVNLQRAQMVAMIVALVNARHQAKSDEEQSDSNKLKHKVYYLRPTLPYRLYGTLVGNERVSTDQTVEMILQAKESKNHVIIPESLKKMFRTQKDLQKDMLGQCLLLGLTFMDICIYKDQERIKQLLMKRQ